MLEASARLDFGSAGQAVRDEWSKKGSPGRSCFGFCFLFALQGFPSSLLR